MPVTDILQAFGLLYLLAVWLSTMGLLYWGCIQIPLRWIDRQFDRLRERARLELGDDDYL